MADWWLEFNEGLNGRRILQGNEGNITYHLLYLNRMIYKGGNFPGVCPLQNTTNWLVSLTDVHKTTGMIMSLVSK